jgi:hypothetical protein
MPAWGRGLAVLDLVVVIALAGCVTTERTIPEPLAAGKPLSDSAAAEKAVAIEKLAGPTALAPALTQPAPAASPTAPVRAATAAVAPVTPSAPAANPDAKPAAAARTPTPCPAGTLGMWSEPDVTGTPVYICRKLRH